MYTEYGSKFRCSKYNSLVKYAHQQNFGLKCSDIVICDLKRFTVSPLYPWVLRLCGFN